MRLNETHHLARFWTYYPMKKQNELQVESDG